MAEKQETRNRGKLGQRNGVGNWSAAMRNPGRLYGISTSHRRRVSC